MKNEKEKKRICLEGRKKAGRDFPFMEFQQSTSSQSIFPVSKLVKWGYCFFCCSLIST